MSNGGVIWLRNVSGGVMHAWVNPQAEKALCGAEIPVKQRTAVNADYHPGGGYYRAIFCDKCRAARP